MKNERQDVPVALNRALLKAVRENALEQAQYCLSRGADANCLDDQDMSGLRPIHIAARNRQLDILRLLLRHGADPRITDRHNLHILTVFAITQDIEAMRAIINGCADLERHESDGEEFGGNSPLEHALISERMESVRFLIDHGADLECIGSQGESMLWRMAQRGHTAAVAALLAAGGPSVAVSKDRSGKSSLDVSIEYAHWETAEVIEQFFRDNGIDLAKGSSSKLLGIKSRFHLSQLFHSLRRPPVAHPNEVEEYQEIIEPGDRRELFSKARSALFDELRWKASQWRYKLQNMFGAGRHLKHRTTRELMNLIHRGQLENAVWLIHSRPDEIFPDAIDAQGAPLLVLAARSLRALQEKNALNGTEDNAIMLKRHEINRTFIDLVDRLVRLGAHIAWSEPERGHNVLHELIDLDQEDVAYELLIRDILTPLINRSTRDLDRPLHLATRRVHRKLTDLLCAIGADVNAIDRQGLSPLHIAAYHANETIGQILLARGANFNLPTLDHRTALHINQDRQEMMKRFEALINARRSIEGAMSIFSPGNPMAAAARRMGDKPKPEKRS